MAIDCIGSHFLHPIFYPSLNFVINLQLTENFIFCEKSYFDSSWWIPMREKLIYLDETWFYVLCSIETSFLDTWSFLHKLLASSFEKVYNHHHIVHRKYKCVPVNFHIYVCSGIMNHSEMLHYARVKIDSFFSITFYQYFSQW